MRKAVPAQPNKRKMKIKLRLHQWINLPSKIYLNPKILSLIFSCFSIKKMRSVRQTQTIKAPRSSDIIQRIHPSSTVSANPIPMRRVLPSRREKLSWNLKHILSKTNLPTLTATWRIKSIPSWNIKNTNKKIIKPWRKLRCWKSKYPN